MYGLTPKYPLSGAGASRVANMDPIPMKHLSLTLALIFLAFPPTSAETGSMLETWLQDNGRTEHFELTPPVVRLIEKPPFKKKQNIVKENPTLETKVC